MSDNRTAVEDDAPEVTVADLATQLKYAAVPLIGTGLWGLTKPFRTITIWVHDGTIRILITHGEQKVELPIPLTDLGLSVLLSLVFDFLH